jgi:hypothetical protein
MIIAFRLTLQRQLNHGLEREAREAIQILMNANLFAGHRWRSLPAILIEPAAHLTAKPSGKG